MDNSVVAQFLSVPGSAWDEKFRKLGFQLRVSKQSFGKVCFQAESGNESKAD